MPWVMKVDRFTGGGAIGTDLHTAGAVGVAAGSERNLGPQREDPGPPEAVI